MFLRWHSTVIVILAIVHSSYGQTLPNYICGGDDDKEGKRICECKSTVCYFKLNIEHFQVREHSPVGIFLVKIKLA